MVMRVFWMFGIALMMLLSTGCKGQEREAQPLEIKVASYNLRMDTENDGLDAWPHRVDMVRGLIRYHKFDLFGTQEGFDHQLNDILQLEEYGKIGVGREDGVSAGEHSAIFYRKDRFELEDSGDFWFSETPDTPSKGWDATCCNRICSWGRFKDLSSGKVFYAFNVHYDHEGQEARRNSSHLLLERIEQITKGLPVIVTGDFNAVPESQPISILYDSGVLYDAYKVSESQPYGTVGTFNGFRIDRPTNGRIDYIWVTEHFSVSDYATLNEQQHGHFPSDHFPVVARLVIK